MPKDRRHASSARRHAAIMFTDIVGYAALMGADEDRAFEVLSINREIHSNLIDQFDGTLIKEMGDGMLISFNLASNAVRCAIEIQKKSKGQDVPLKIGIHEGEMVFEGNDVLGDGVNIASRLQEETEESCITISGSVYRDIKNKSGIKAEFIEEKSFKNVDEPIKVYSVICDEVHQKNVSPLMPKQKAHEKKSIIVLPFENLSPDPENGFFGDGLTEELIAELCKVHSLLVISRTSAMQFKGAKKSVPEIAREVNVSYVLEGSVRRAGNNLRITAQLIDASTDTHLWIDRYSGTFDDIFDLQEKLARRIVESLKGSLTPDEKRRLAARPISDPYILEVWLKAKNELWTFTKEGMENSRQLLNKAIEVVGENSLLYAGLGYWCWAAYDFGISYKEETLSEGEKYAKKSIELDPEQPLAYIAQGLISYKHGDMNACTLNIQRAIELGSAGEALEFFGLLLAEAGKIPEAHQYADLICASNPLSWLPLCSKACVNIIDGRFNDALTIFNETELKLAPKESIFYWWLAQAAAFAGKEDEAHDAFERVVRLKAGVFSEFSNLFLHAMNLDLKGVNKILETTMLTQIAETDEWFPIYLANCLIQVGENEKAMYYLDRAINWGFSNHKFLSTHNRFLQPLHGDPRFEKLLVKAKEKQDNFKV
jgi:adenylate cyclase